MTTGISQNASKKILGIEEDVSVDSRDMARTLVVTFFPCNEKTVSPAVLRFAKELKSAFERLHVTVLPYVDARKRVPLWRVLKRMVFVAANNIVYLISFPFGRERKRIWMPLSLFRYLVRRVKIKRGISVIALGELPSGNLPIDYTASFRESSVVTILDMPAGISRDTPFSVHFDTAIKLFAYHMSNIIIAADDKDWLLYNFNASHPFYSIHNNFEENLLSALIPKLAAPMRPHTFKDFIFDRTQFDPDKEPYRALIADMKEGGALLERAGLYPPGKKIADLPFRNSYYRWIGKVHLDNRSGMSYGFLARQLPTEIAEAYSAEEAKARFGRVPEDECFTHGDTMYVFLHLPQGALCVRVPPVWILTQRSGANKTRFNPKTDLVIMGLSSGKMFLRAPKHSKLDSGFRPSYDTKVILAHAVGNALVASALRFLFPKNNFSRILEESGLALAHWHGYIHPEQTPDGWHAYGFDNPHVACSTAQAALYAIHGKMRALAHSLKEKKEFSGDIHIEPQHGSNVTFPSLRDLGAFMESAPGIASLGNAYLDAYVSPPPSRT